MQTIDPLDVRCSTTYVNQDGDFEHTSSPLPDGHSDIYSHFDRQQRAFIYSCRHCGRSTSKEEKHRKDCPREIRRFYLEPCVPKDIPSIWGWWRRLYGWEIPETTRTGG